jgi:hypothetical protein
LCLAALAAGCMFGRSPPDTDAGAGAGRAFADAAPIVVGGTVSDGGAVFDGGGGTVLPVRAIVVGPPRPHPLPLARATSRPR